MIALAADRKTTRKGYGRLRLSCGSCFAFAVEEAKHRYEVSVEDETSTKELIEEM